MPFDKRKLAYDVRHHVRHELRVRLRLPARQHGGAARPARPAQPQLRDRGRGRLDPRRRGADAADHLRRARDRRAVLLRFRPHRARLQAASPPRARRQRARTRPRPRAPTTSTTRSTRPSRPPRRRSRRSTALGIDNLYDPRNSQVVNHLIQALKAQALYQRDVDYVIRDGEVKIVDEFTGRIMEGRRWSEGLHQAIEAKEGVRPGGERHARHDHAPELLPPVREARRHDRHREDRGEGVRRDLQPRRRRDPDEQAGAARTRTT